MDIVLADLTIGGEEIKAILHAPKNGFFYVINRKTGKLFSAEPFAETTWASHIDLATGRPGEIPGARYETGPALITPNLWGGSQLASGSPPRGGSPHFHAISMLGSSLMLQGKYSEAEPPLLKGYHGLHERKKPGEQNLLELARQQPP